MGRFRQDLLDRVEQFAHAVADLAEQLSRAQRPRRIVDQLWASGSSVGANTFETDEALSRPDFCRGVGIVLKELAETRYWLRFVERRGWAEPALLAPLHQEATELRLIFGTILSKTRRSTKT